MRLTRLLLVFGALAFSAAQLAAQQHHADTVFIFLDSAGNPEFIRANFVTTPPKLLPSPPPTYPDLYRQAGVQGRVVVEAVVNTDGTVDSSSVRVVETSSEGFNWSAIAWMRHARFEPGRLNGHRARVLLRIPLDYKIRR